MIKQTKHELMNWTFQFKESGLATSQELDQISQELQLFRPPTIVFINTSMKITHQNTSFSLLFNAKEALRFINYKARETGFTGKNNQEKITLPNTISYIPQRLEVKHAKHWKDLQKPKDIQITEIQESSDSFFLTPFKGHLSSTSQIKIQKSSENVIPLEKLGPNNPITFYSQASFYQDQLDDNGLIQYQYKFRTMNNSWFGLIRNYARIDEVSITIMDVRVYWEEGWTKIARQFMVKRSSYKQIKQAGFQFGPGWTMNGNQSHLVYPFLGEQFVDNQYVHFA